AANHAAAPYPQTAPDSPAAPASHDASASSPHGHTPAPRQQAPAHQPLPTHQHDKSPTTLPHQCGTTTHHTTRPHPAPTQPQVPHPTSATEQHSPPPAGVARSTRLVPRA